MDRHVKVQVPGKHFPALTTAEKRVFYSGEAAEYRERHDFPRHLQAWGEKHTGPGIRFLCPSDVIDDPDHKGFWTTLGLWNKWRHSTYVNDREAEKQYLDELPAARQPVTQPAQPVKAEPEIKQHFNLVRTGSHTVGGTGKMAGKVFAATWYICRKEGCPHSHPSEPIPPLSPPRVCP